MHPQFPYQLGRTYARRTANSWGKHLAMHGFLSKLPDDFAPSECDYTGGIMNWGMMLNDNLGCCTIAAPGHMIQGWTVMAGAEVTVSDTAILQAYELFDGYVQEQPQTDRGGDMLTVQQDWQQKSIGGHFISGFGEVNMTQMRWQQALYVFGSVNVGVQLPQGFEDQVGGTWDFDSSKPVNPPDPTQGHDMAVLQYDPDGVTFITWGARQRATWRWCMMYADECLAVISPEWTKSPVPVTELVADLQQISS